MGINKRHKAIKPMTLSDVKLRQKDKVEHMAQLLQDLPLYDDLDPEARLETLTDGIVRCAQLAFTLESGRRRMGGPPLLD